MDTVSEGEFRAQWCIIKKGNINSGLKEITAKVDVDLCILSCFHGTDSITWIQSFWNFFLGVSKVKREKQFCLTHQGMALMKTTVPPVYHFLIVTIPLTLRSCSNEVSEEYWRADICKLDFFFTLWLHILTLWIGEVKLLPQKGLRHLSALEQL